MLQEIKRVVSSRKTKTAIGLNPVYGDTNTI